MSSLDILLYVQIGCAKHMMSRYFEVISKNVLGSVGRARSL